MQIKQLEQWIDQYLSISLYHDYAPNGLQVEGKSQVRKIVLGVSACQSLLEQAILRQADAVIVHHGYFWKNEPAPLVGMKGRRIKSLMQHDINLLAYHLPLDGHLVCGNNIQLGRVLQIQNIRRFCESDPTSLIFQGELPTPMSSAQFAVYIGDRLSRPPMYSHEISHPIKRVAWCTGGAQDYLDEVCGTDIDAFISGEVSERTIHTARENNVVYFAAGHHATERYGIQALGVALEQQFPELECEFIDIDNPA